MLPINTTSTAANLSKYQPNATLTYKCAHVEVAMKISVFFASVTSRRVIEKAAVKPATMPRRAAILVITQRTTTARIGRSDEIAVARMDEILNRRDLEYSYKHASSSTGFLNR